MNIGKETSRAERARVEAAYWYTEVQDLNLSPAKLRRWQTWIQVPVNRQAFDAAELFWHQLGGLPKPAWPSDAEVAEDTYDGSHSIAEHRRRQRLAAARGSLRSTRVWVGFALAASLVAGLGVAFGRFGVSEHRASAPFSVFETEAAQHENVMLIDGSQVRLGARTAITSNVSRDVRFIVMDRGEAEFKVAHDPKRPFRVLAGGGIITAVGTAFNVRRLDNLVIVTVSEGTVEVAPANAMVGVTSGRGGDNVPPGKRVTAGQAINYDTQGKMSAVRQVNIETAMSWRDGLLQYEDEPLGQVIQDINRYSRKTVAIADARAAEMMYTGTVFERDIDDWVAALPEAFEDRIEVSEPDSRHVVIRSKDN